MSSSNGKAPDAVEPRVPKNEWTIMIFFAGDPHLSPSMTAQLKAIKDAGFQENVSVLVHYDPNEKGVAVTTFDINSKRKKDLLDKGLVGTKIGDGRDPYVRNLLEDAITGVGALRANTADQALRAFLDIGATEKYRAKHYMIFLVGHGVIVGNDTFLPDSNPQSGISLEQLGDTLRHFQGSIPEDSAFELLGLHSCSMSAIEVIYELKDTARYMMATEGTSFVASWPYRQLLKRILNEIDEAKKEDASAEINVDELITSIHNLSLHNSTDFMFSGLSADLCLSSLDKDRVQTLTTPMENLTKALKRALKTPDGWDARERNNGNVVKKDWRSVELIKLAHLEAQSFYQETSTDLYDFCLCLARRCDEDDEIQNAMKVACGNVIEKLEETPESVIVHSDHFGPQSQYSHGLSIFFPWARPVQEEPLVLDDNMLSRYEKYDFNKALGKNSWLSFLDDYFTATQRKTREEEDGKPIEKLISENGIHLSAIGERMAAIVDALAKDSPGLTKDSPGLVKDSPGLKDGCGCIVKNYPTQFSISERVIRDPNPKATAKEEAEVAKLAEEKAVAPTRP